MKQSTLLVNDMSRLFIRRDSCSGYKFENCYSLSDISQSRDAPAIVEIPNGRGGFAEADIIKGGLGRVSTEISAYDNLNYTNSLDEIFQDDCEISIQVHFGRCQRPDDFNAFHKVITLSKVHPTDFTKSPLVAKNSSERENITTTLGLSARDFHTIVNPSYKGRILDYQGAIVSLDAQYPGSCANCPCNFTNKTTILALQVRDSLCIGPDGIYAELWLMYSFDDGVTFNSIEITDINFSTIYEPLFCSPSWFLESVNIRIDGSMFVITAGHGQSIVYDINTLFRHNELQVLSYTGHIGAFDSYIVYDSVVCNGYTYFAGANGNAWKINNTDGSVEKILLDSHTTSNLYSIDCYDGNFIIGGVDGIWIGSGTNAKFVTDSIEFVVSVGINANRYIATDADSVYLSCICDGNFNKTWTRPVDYCIKDISFYNEDVGFAILNSEVYGPAIYRTIDGGYTFTRVSNIVLPTTYTYMEIKAVSPNKFYAVGLNDYNSNLGSLCYPDYFFWIESAFQGIFLQSYVV